MKPMLIYEVKESFYNSNYIYVIKLDGIGCIDFIVLTEYTLFYP